MNMIVGINLLAAGGSRPSVDLPASGLLLGVLLIVAVGGGYLAHWARVPRVVGYLLAGAAVRVAVSGVVDQGSGIDESISKAQALLAPIKELALGLILFTIGGIFDTRHVRGMGRGVLIFGAWNALTTAVLVCVGVTIVGLAVGAGVPFTTLLAFAALLGLAAVSTAPAATLFTLQEYESKGPVTDMLLGVTGFNAVLALVGFHGLFMFLAGLGVLEQVDLSLAGAWGGLGLVVVGSVVLGGLLGFVTAVAHARLRPIETLLILLAGLMALAAGSHVLMRLWGVSYSPLLAAMCVGVVFANAAADQDRLTSLLAVVGPPLYVGFFALAGFGLHFEDLWAAGGIGITYVGCRAGGKLLGCYVAARRLEQGAQKYKKAQQIDHADGHDVTVASTSSSASGKGDASATRAGVSGISGGSSLGAGLLCQAAVVISLADFVAAHWQDPWAGKAFTTTILGSAVVFEIVGPSLIKWFVVRCGEVKAVTLLRHGGATPGQSRSVMAMTVESLSRAFGIRRRRLRVGDGVRADEADGPLLVRHLMRANVKCIPAAAGFDEVLKMVEQSRYNHFPVINGESQLVGVIHYKDLNDILYDPSLYHLVTAGDLSIADARSVCVDTPMAEAWALFRSSEVGSLPVLDDSQSRRVVGVLEQRDVLLALGPGGGGNGGDSH